jgi:hypothetical protein
VQSIRYVVTLAASMILSGAPFQLPMESWSDLQLLRSVELEGDTYHVQGVDFNNQSLWVTSVDTTASKGRLHEFSLATGKMERTEEIQDGARFHPGGIASDEQSIWIPVAEYRRTSTSVIQRRNKRTLQLEFAFSVSDHIGCVAVTPDYLIGGNWDSLEFYVWDHSGKLLRTVSNETHNAYQDMKFDGRYIVASGLLSDGSGAIDWIDFPSFHLVHRVKAERTDRQVPFTREGMAIRGSQLLLLPEDSPSRAFIFRMKN